MSAGLGTVLAASVLLPAGPAQATPYSCYDRYTAHSYSVTCVNGTGEYRAKVKCYKIGGTSYVTRYGKWLQTHIVAWSNAVCTSNEDPTSGTWETR
ncbi:hypothetical protein GCM10022226_19180 [Sphaerisporangium flaviroseum]|uniref:Secreted protein n=1 Tax=Sphaerisporangium flaviroseum TaxID=509199 RepID=A0ABP7HRJ9_9ACTN